MDLTDRQQRELEYHRARAVRAEALLAKPLSLDVVHNPHKRWWNAYWQTYAHLLRLNLAGKRVLVIGCGFGYDAIRVAKMGAEVYAFDLSPESLEIAAKISAREQVAVRFSPMPAEQMSYPDNFFDCFLAVDILHHVDIPKTMREIQRVAKKDSVLVMDEIYSHTWTERLRHSWLVEKVLYGRMKKMIYGTATPYITADERKMSEKDVAHVKRVLRVTVEDHFNFLVGRIVPDYATPARVDRTVLRLLRRIGHLLAGRILIVGEVKK